MCAHMNSEHITIEQMKKWKEDNNRDELKKAEDKANRCPLCKRAWMKFWSQAVV